MLLIPYYTHSHTMSSTTAPAVLLSLHLLLLLFCYPYIYCSCCSNIPTSMHCSCCSVFPYIYCSCHSVIPTSTAPAVLLSLHPLLLLFCHPYIHCSCCSAIPTSTAPAVLLSLRLLLLLFCYPYVYCSCCSVSLHLLLLPPNTSMYCTHFADHTDYLAPCPDFREEGEHLNSKEDNDKRMEGRREPGCQTHRSKDGSIQRDGTRYPEGRS